jgi:hypothetical protein
MEEDYFAPAHRRNFLRLILPYPPQSVATCFFKPL